MDNKEIKLIDMVLQQEGGYSSGQDEFSKEDLGGETYRGISRKFYPSWYGWNIIDASKPLKYGQIIKNQILENNVRQFYDKYFYTPMKIAKIDNLLIAGHVFCHGVNAGKKASIKLLQKAINKTYSVNIAVDGVIGKETLKYTNGKQQYKLANELIEQRNQFYKNIVNNKPSQKKFLNGWLNRVKNTTKVCSSRNVFTTSILSTDLLSKILNLILKIVKALIK